MSDNPQADRPRQVTIGASVAGLASGALLLVVISRMGNFRTVDFRAGVEEFLAVQRRSGLKLDLDQALLVIRIGLLVTGAACAAMLVLAVFAMRRDKSARIALSVLAVPLALCGLFVDPFLAGFVVAATIMLWSGPASDWYAGRAPRPQQTETVTARGTVPPPTAPAAPPAPSANPWGGVAATAPAGPPSWGPPPVVPPRPGALVLACVVTWVASLSIAGLMVLTAVTVHSDAGRTALETALRDNPQAQQAGLEVGALATAVSVLSGLIALWALAAVVFAALMLSRRRWARITLLVSTGVAGVLGLLAAAISPGFLLVPIAAGAVVVLLLRREVVAWFAPAPPR